MYLDLIVQAKSGTGKTVVFVVCTLETVDVKFRACQAIIIVPTREVAVQVKQVFNTIGKSIEGK